jgi:hypothetical protein
LLKEEIWLMVNPQKFRVIPRFSKLIWENKWLAGIKPNTG